MRLQASGAAKYAYDQAAGLKNAAGQSWDEAMQGAYKGWEGTKKSTQQTWDDVSVGEVVGMEVGGLREVQRVCWVLLSDSCCRSAL